VVHAAVGGTDGRWGASAVPAGLPPWVIGQGRLRLPDRGRWKKPQPPELVYSEVGEQQEESADATRQFRERKREGVGPDRY